MSILRRAGFKREAKKYTPRPAVNAPVPTTVFITPSAFTIVNIGTQQLTAQVVDQFTNTYIGPVTWQSSNPSVATVDANGLVTYVSLGSATITAFGPMNLCSGTSAATMSSGAQSAAITGTAASSFYETAVVSGGRTIVITLTGTTFVAAGATFDAQRQGIINGIVAATSPANGFNNLRSTIPVTACVRTSASVVTITLPALGSYSITSNESLSVTVPSAATVAGTPIAATPNITIIEGGAGNVLLTETFADSSFASRGWYDLSSTDRVATPAPSGLPGSLRMTWTAGQTNASTRTMRRAFTATDRVYVKYQTAFSSNWVGSGQTYHPHVAMLTSDADGDYANTADSFLAIYSEVNYQSGNRPAMKFQDNQYVDAAHIGTNFSEARATCGANGQQGYADSWDLYADGGVSHGWYNSRNLLGAVAMAAGNTAWHTVEFEVILNTVTGGIGQTDGICRYWWDGALIWERTNLIMRTATRPNLKMDHFLFTPYIGDGSPATQTMYIADLTVATARPTTFDPLGNRPSGFTNVVTDYPFSTVVPTSSDASLGDGSGWNISSNGGGNTARVVDTTGPRSPGYAAQWTYAPGHTAGTSVGKFYRSLGSATRYYISLAVWHSDTFDFNTVSNKFVTFFNSDGGTDLLETSHNGAPWVWQFERPGTTILYGPNTAFGSALTLAGLRGTWWNIEIEYNGGVGNGSMRVWAGRSDGSDGPVGQLVMEYTGINVYLPGPEFQLDSTWGGGPPETPDVTSYRRIDHFYMSTP